jgi:virginiamycin A acetyltransferase
MNGANHLVDSFSTYTFGIFANGWEHAMDGKTYPFKGDTLIGNDVWIGYRAAIMAGVKIGDGAIIGAYSVVTKDVEPYSVVAGNPAKLIKLRFPASTIDLLLKIRWWDWPAEKLARHVQDLTGNDPAALEKLAADDAQLH